MKVDVAHWGNRSKRGVLDLEDVVRENLLTVSEPRGRLEECEAVVQRQAAALAKVVAKLADLGLLTLDEAEELAEDGVHRDFKPAP